MNLGQNEYRTHGGSHSSPSDFHGAHFIENVADPGLVLGCDMKKIPVFLYAHVRESWLHRYAHVGEFCLYTYVHVREFSFTC